MSARRIALLRGINVGRAKRVKMAELRELFEALGCREVRTLLNSGNVVFTPPARGKGIAAAKVEAALEARCGFSARVVLLGADELAEILEGNPLTRAAATEPTRLMAGVLVAPSDRAAVEPLLERDWRPEAIGLGRRVAYYWCPEGVLKSPLAEAVARALGDRVTARNWATMTKLGVLAQGAG